MNLSLILRNSYIVKKRRNDQTSDDLAKTILETLLELRNFEVEVFSVILQHKKSYDGRDQE